MSKCNLSPGPAQGRKRTGLINQMFIRPAFMRSRAGCKNKTVFDIPQVCLHTPSNKLSTSKDHYSLPPPNA